VAVRAPGLMSARRRSSPALFPGSLGQFVADDRVGGIAFGLLLGAVRRGGYDCVEDVERNRSPPYEPERVELVDEVVGAFSRDVGGDLASTVSRLQRTPHPQRRTSWPPPRIVVAPSNRVQPDQPLVDRFAYQLSEVRLTSPPAGSNPAGGGESGGPSVRWHRACIRR